MDKRFSLLAGITLILVGGLSLMVTTMLSVFGLDAGLWGLRFWPMLVLGVGGLFIAPPFLVRGRPALGSLFIPGLPIVATGGLLLFTSVLNLWRAWEWLWPLEVLAVALGFLIAAIYTRWVWLVIPAIIIGLNGLALQFCALTGWWSAWAALWTVEPLAVGLSLIVVSAKTNSSGLALAGLVVCGLASLGLVGMMAIWLGGWGLLNWLGPIALILAGGLLLLWGLARRPTETEAAA